MSVRLRGTNGERIDLKYDIRKHFIERRIQFFWMNREYNLRQQGLMPHWLTGYRMLRIYSLVMQLILKNIPMTNWTRIGVYWRSGMRVCNRGHGWKMDRVLRLPIPAWWHRDCLVQSYPALLLARHHQWAPIFSNRHSAGEWIWRYKTAMATMRNLLLLTPMLLRLNLRNFPIVHHNLSSLWSMPADCHCCWSAGGGDIYRKIWACESSLSLGPS